MPKPLERFFKEVHERNVDDAILEADFVQEQISNLEDFGKDLEQKIKDFGKKPVKQVDLPPTYQESAFIKRGKETTLYNVTNSEKDVPLTEKVSHIFKKTSYSVRSFLVSANYKEENKKYSLYAGEKVGFGFKKQEGSGSSEIKALYNVSNKKSSVEYSSSTPYNSYRVSIYNQNERSGVALSYNNNTGLHTAFSCDNRSASVSVGYKKETEHYSTNLSTYATTGEKYSNPQIGVTGRITF